MIKLAAPLSLWLFALESVAHPRHGPAAGYVHAWNLRA